MQDLPEAQAMKDCPSSVAEQLKGMSLLMDGWLDGEGTVYSVDDLAWAESVLTPWRPVPYVYPVAEGGLQAEWECDDSDVWVVAHLDLAGRTVAMSAGRHTI
jgi:hypothetical protein